MSDICGINFAPLVLRDVGCHYFTALSGYVNAHRTFGAQKGYVKLKSSPWLAQIYNPYL